MVWFAPLGWLYRPVSILGWVMTALAIAFCVNTFLAVDARSHSNSDTLYGVFPFWAPTFLLWLALASKTARRKA